MRHKPAQLCFWGSSTPTAFIVGQHSSSPYTDIPKQARCQAQAHADTCADVFTASHKLLHCCLQLTDIMLEAVVSCSHKTIHYALLLGETASKCSTQSVLVLPQRVL